MKSRPRKAYPAEAEESAKDQGSVESTLQVAIKNAQHACTKKALQLCHDVTLGLHDEGLAAILDDWENCLSQGASADKAPEPARAFLKDTAALCSLLEQASGAGVPQNTEAGPPPVSLRTLARVDSDVNDPAKLQERSEAWRKAQGSRRKLVQFFLCNTRDDYLKQIDRFVKATKVVNQLKLNQGHILWSLSMDTAGESDKAPWKLRNMLSKLETAESKSNLAGTSVFLPLPG